jgi:hypothetical protein
MTEESTDYSVIRCPSCQAELGLGDVLCTACGYHMIRQTHITPQKKSPAAEAAAGDDSPKPKKRKKKKRYLWGLLHGGNAMALCSGMGLMLGVLAALVLGTLFAAGNQLIFELSIHTFVGAIGGAAVGGGIGYVLASILPSPTGDESSHQLRNGLITVVWGFVITGIGLLSFAVFNDMEANGRSPGTMFKLSLALYELTGKWGVLLILGGGGLAIIVLGFRAMLPGASAGEGE